jgi:hypothetical protein
MLLTVLQIMENGNINTMLVCSDTDFQDHSFLGEVLTQQNYLSAIDT